MSKKAANVNSTHLLLAGTAATLAVAVGLLTILLHQKALISPKGVVSGVSTESSSK